MVISGEGGKGRSRKASQTLSVMFCDLNKIRDKYCIILTFVHQTHKCSLYFAL